MALSFHYVRSVSFLRQSLRLAPLHYRYTALLPLWKDKIVSYGSMESIEVNKMIEVGNGNVIGWIGEDRHYIGRIGYGRQGSALANIFVIGKDGTRDEVIAKYRIWLEGIVKKGKGAAWDELQRLRERYRKDEKVKLLCYCKPLGCHGDVLIEYIKE